jgi:hypothetical protein
MDLSPLSRPTPLATGMRHGLGQTIFSRLLPSSRSPLAATGK